MPQYILSHDLGTSGNKASLFGDEGTLISSFTQEYRTSYPEPGWAEQNPNDWWSAVCTATKKVLEGVDKNQIAAIAVTGQMMGTVAVGYDGSLVGNSIIWSDSRAERECGLLIERLGADCYYKITGQPPSAAYSLPKMMWLKENRPEQYRNTYQYVQSKDYINYLLTGKLRTDHTDAAYTIAYDIWNKTWSEEILEASGIDKKKMPEIGRSSEILGRVTKWAAEACGVPEGTLVVTGAGDGSSAHLGAGCIEPGDSYICLGSSTWIVSQTETLIFDRLGRMQSEPHVLDNQYCFLGTMQTGGLAHSWGRENLSGGSLDYKEIDRMVQQSEAGAGGMLFLPYLLGERSPWYDLQVKASFLGVHIHSRHEDFYRAIMEGVAMNLNLMLNVIQEHQKVGRIVAIGGGANSQIWMQILADVCNVEIAIPENTAAGTSIGSAIIAGVGTGIWNDYSVAKKFLKIGSVLTPNPEAVDLYRKRQDAFEAAYHALRDWNHRYT